MNRGVFVLKTNNRKQQGYLAADKVVGGFACRVDGDREKRKVLNRFGLLGLIMA